MRNFKPVYKEEERPLIGFTATSTGGAHINIKIADQTLLYINFEVHTTAYNKQDAQSFIDNLQKIVNNME